MTGDPGRPNLRDLLGALDAESLQLEEWVSDPELWTRVTTDDGWTVADQIGHLASTDDAALQACTDRAGFERLLRAVEADPGTTDSAAREWSSGPRTDVLDRWTRGRRALATALSELPPGDRIPWFGPPMSAMSMVTARLMETWAHGHDIADVAGIDPPRTDRIRHVCDLGVRTRRYSFLNRGLPAPTAEVQVELRSPSGRIWTWGPPAAADVVTGDAWDLALVVTRRRHWRDTGLDAHGAVATQWLDVAQAFAGPPGRDPARRGNARNWVG